MTSPVDVEHCKPLHFITGHFFWMAIKNHLITLIILCKTEVRMSWAQHCQNLGSGFTAGLASRAELLLSPFNPLWSLFSLDLGTLISVGGPGSQSLYKAEQPSTGTGGGNLRLVPTP